jgi:hypothetical protein
MGLRGRSSQGVAFEDAAGCPACLSPPGRRGRRRGEEEMVNEKMKVKIEMEGFDDWTADIISIKVIEALRMAGVAVYQNARPCKKNIEYQDMETSLAIIIRDYCLAITDIGHIHLTGEKIYGETFKTNLMLVLKNDGSEEDQKGS